MLKADWCKIPNENHDMPGPAIDSFLLLVFFIYGLAFFGMGLTLALESERSPAMTDAHILRFLAAFGMIHGTHEWLESYLMQSEAAGSVLPSWIPWLRLGMLIASFGSLLAYGALTLRAHPVQKKIYDYAGWSVVFVYGTGILASAIWAYHGNTTVVSWPIILDALTRYLLAVPGAFLAALALWTEGQRARLGGRMRIGLFLDLAAAGFAIYGVTQIFVPMQDMFPARYLNAEAFQALTHLPIQLVRTLSAVLVTFSLLRVTQLVEKERQQSLASVQQERLQALERIRLEMTERENMRRELLRHTVHAQEEERARIARELHDETSQVLTAFSLDLATLQNAVSKNSKAAEMVDRLRSLSKQMSQGLYRLVHDLRPAQLDDLGLIPALDYIKDSTTSAGLDVSMNVLGKARRLDAVVETVLFRVAQESLNNVVRHAKTRQAQIHLIFKPQEVTLQVIDDGIGFNPAQTFAPPRGWGLAGIRERVEAIGGKLTIESGSKKGTTIEVVVPVFDIIP
jgi:signal transduction histidine kinase